MTQSGRVDYDQVARAQALLLDRRRLSPDALVRAYRTVRTATPTAYTEQFIEALISQGHSLSGEASLTAWTEAAEIARGAVQTDPRLTRLLLRALNVLQHGLSDVGRRPEALDVCREMAIVDKRGHEAGVLESRTIGSWQLACRLAEEGEHSEAARLFERIARDLDREQTNRVGSFWTHIAWTAELKAAGDQESACEALRRLIDKDLQEAENHTGPYAMVIWELLLLASMQRDRGHEQQAELCAQQIEELLTMLAATGKPKNWTNILAFWAVLVALTGRAQDRFAPGEPQPPLFASHQNWSPDVLRTYLGEGRENLLSELIQITELAEREPSAQNLSRLVEVQRKSTLRSVNYWQRRTWHITDALRLCFDEAVDLASRLAEVDEPRGRAALSRALADRAGMHVAARDFPSALDDFRQARRALGGRLPQPQNTARAA